MRFGIFRGVTTNTNISMHIPLLFILFVNVIFEKIYSMNKLLPYRYECRRK